MIIINQETQDIALTRGDYAAFVFNAYQDDGVTLYNLAEGDTVQLEVGKKYGNLLKEWKKTKENSLTTTSTDYTIEIQPEDTKDMKFGDYVYDVSIITADGEVCTYIGARKDDKGHDIEPKFTILKEVGGSDDD